MIGNVTTGLGNVPTAGQPPSGGGSGLTTTVNVGIDTQTVSFSGLNGNTVRRFRMEGYLFFPERAAAEPIVIRLNGATTNQSSNGRVVAVANGTESAMSAAAVAGSVINDVGGAVGGNGGTLKFWAELYASTGQWRLVRTWGFLVFNAVFGKFTSIATGCYEDAATNITSIDVRAASAGTILAGSTVSLISGGS